MSPYAYFAERLDHGGIVRKICRIWIEDVLNDPEKAGKEYALEKKQETNGASTYYYDFGHIAPDWERLLSLGFTGMLDEIERRRAENEESGSLTKAQTDCYESFAIAYRAVIKYISRLKNEVDIMLSESPANGNASNLQ